MADLYVLEELRDYLVGQGVGQVPAASSSVVLPSIWLDPRDGAPEPRDGENITITLRDTMLAAAGELEAWIEEAFIDVIVRSRTAAPGKLVQRSIRNLIHPITAHGGRFNWTMNNLLVEYSTMWRADQKLSPPNDTASASGGTVYEHPTFDRVQSFRFGARRKALAGLPTVP
jgi:hypothetical protein